MRLLQEQINRSLVAGFLWPAFSEPLVLPPNLERSIEAVFQKKQRLTIVWEMSVHLRIAVSLS